MRCHERARSQDGTFAEVVCGLGRRIFGLGCTRMPCWCGCGERTRAIKSYNESWGIFIVKLNTSKSLQVLSHNSAIHTTALASCTPVSLC
jgi:hypothetical protein